jgi:hypothetical protein
MTTPRRLERGAVHAVWTAFVLVALVSPPDAAGRLPLAALGVGTWWYAGRGRSSRVLAIAVFLVGWFGGPWSGWIALSVAVVVRRALFGNAGSPAASPAAQPVPTVEGRQQEKPSRTPEEVIAAWPLNARDVLAATEREHGDGHAEAILRDPRKYVRIYAIGELGRRRDARAVDALAARLWDEDFLTRLYSARALARIGNEDARRRLFDAFTRAWAAQTRYDRRDDSMPPEDVETSSREATPLRELSESLFFVGPSAVEPLLAALRDGSDRAMEWTVVPLGALGAIEAVPLMLDRLSGDGHFIRTQVREAIFRIGPRALPLLMEREDKGSEPARALVRHLIRVFQGRPPECAEGPPDQGK